MGNRAVITTRKNLENDGIGIYLHWNGGQDSVRAFLEYCKLCGFSSPEKDNYSWASLTTVISNFFGNTGLNVRVDRISCLDCDNGDNGVYLIRDWQIVDRRCFCGNEQNVYPLEDMLIDIDNAQPTPLGLAETTDWKDKIK